MTDVIHQGGCTTNYASNNNADGSVQPYEGEPSADKEWMSRHNKERIMDGKRLEVLRSRLERSETVDVRLSLRFSSVLNVSIV